MPVTKRQQNDTTAAAELRKLEDEVVRRKLRSFARQQSIPEDDPALIDKIVASVRRTRSKLFDELYGTSKKPSTRFR